MIPIVTQQCNRHSSSKCDNEQLKAATQSKLDVFLNVAIRASSLSLICKKS